MLAWHSTQTEFTEIEHHKREEGSSGYSPFKLIKMSLLVLLNYTALPLKFITNLGILSSLVSFGFGIYYIVQKLNKDAELLEDIEITSEKSRTELEFSFNFSIKICSSADEI